MVALLKVLFWTWLVGMFALGIAGLLMWRMRKYNRRLIIVQTMNADHYEIGDVLLASGAPAHVVEVHPTHLVVELM